MSGPGPWKCPECRAWVAPHVTEHRCDPPAAVISVTSIDPPGLPGPASMSISTATLPGTVTVNVATSGADVARAIQRTVLEQAASNWTLPGRAA